jgi:hypothetical protein
LAMFLKACMQYLRSLFLCCMNSGCMGNLMHGLKHLASSPQYTGAPPGEDQGARRREREEGEKREGEGEEDAVAEALRRWTPDLPAPPPPHRRGGGLHNFRELLWYWSEYYLRRGRDRLSLEFSTHISFHEWHSVVGKQASSDSLLCKKVILYC